MDNVNFLYWKVIALCFIVAITFFFFTTETLIQGKLKLPSWVFSSFTFVIGFYFFSVFLRSLSELKTGSHDSIDELLDICHITLKFFGLGHLM